MNLFDQLNEQQQSAVSHFQGPALVVAAAGAGKTRVLTYRIAHLLQNGVSPYAILALTFTNKAAQHMKNQIAELIAHTSTDINHLWMGTFHSIFAKILRIEHQHISFSPNFTIYDRQDSLNLVKTIIREFSLDEKNDYKPAYILSVISHAKNRFEQEIDIKKLPRANAVFQRYKARCRQADAMDFDDLLVNFAELLLQQPEVLEKYQRKFQYLLVDEFQDTNYIQNFILIKLAALHKNIFVVGDDSQSIYSFRGADIGNILNFRNTYPDTSLYKLEQNYRSTQTIVKASNTLIKNNLQKIKKTVFSDKKPGDKIRLLHATTDMEEGFLVAQAVYSENYFNDVSLNDMAILYRTNYQSRIFEEALSKKRIPYRIFGGISFYQRKEVKDFLAYIRFAINQNDEEAFKRIVNFPRRGIGQTTVSNVLAETQRINQPLSWVLANIERTNILNKGIAKKLHQFFALIKSFHSLLGKTSAIELARQICQETQFLRVLEAGATAADISRVENIEELLNDIQSFSETETALGNPDDLNAYLGKISLLTSLDEEDKGVRQRVTLMTIHAAKGLEFKQVYIVGAEEKLLPSYGKKAVIDQQELEEERRLFYVALTRAMEKATISLSTMRFRWGTTITTKPSRFIDEIDSTYLEKPKGEQFVEKQPYSPRSFANNIKRQKTTYSPINTEQNFATQNAEDIQVGMNIVHSRFGKGKVLTIEGNLPTNKTATVFFQNIGQKKLLLKYAKLKVLT